MTSLTLAVVSFAGAAAVVLAQAVPVPNELSGWLTGSAVSVLAFNFVAFLRGWIVAGRSHDRVIAERDAALKKNDELVAEMRQMIMPLLAEVTKSALQAGRKD